MVQKEVASRLSAEKKTKHYGRISVLIQVVADVEVPAPLEEEADLDAAAGSAGARFGRAS